MRCTTGQVALHKIAATAILIAVVSAVGARAQAQATPSTGFEMTDEDAAEDPAPAPGEYRPYGLSPPQPYGYQPSSPYASPGPHPYVPTPPAFTLPTGPLPTLSSLSVEPPASYGGREYDDTIRAAARAEEMRQGELSGGWTLKGAAGALLYVFELAQSPEQPFMAQGAWRRLGAPAARESIGYLSMAAYDGSQLTLRFNQGPAGELRVVTLRRDSTGRWAGELWRPSGVEPVVLTR